MAYIYSHNFRGVKLLMENLRDRLPYSPYYFADRHGNLTHYTYTMMFCDAVFYVLYAAAIIGFVHYSLYSQGMIT